MCLEIENKITKRRQSMTKRRRKRADGGEEGERRQLSLAGK